MSDKVKDREEVDDGDDAASAEERARQRAQRQAEIEAIKREMLSTKPASHAMPPKEVTARDASSASSSSSSDTSDSSDSEDSEQEADADSNLKREWTAERFPFHF